MTRVTRLIRLLRRWYRTPTGLLNMAIIAGAILSGVMSLEWLAIILLATALIVLVPYKFARLQRDLDSVNRRIDELGVQLSHRQRIGGSSAPTPTRSAPTDSVTTVDDGAATRRELEALRQAIAAERRHRLALQRTILVRMDKTIDELGPGDQVG